MDAGDRRSRPRTRCLIDMTRVLIAQDARQREDAFAVRIAVFVEEQQIPRSEELDEFDETAVHCVGYDGDVPVAAGRLVVGDGYGKIGRMAVLASHRGRGDGRAVLEALERYGSERGLREFRLNAQMSARGFYERMGYEVTGDLYYEVGIPHIEMRKRI